MNESFEKSEGQLKQLKRTMTNNAQDKKQLKLNNWGQRAIVSNIRVYCSLTLFLWAPEPDDP
ncbi:MAG: hypothetical protein IMF15_00270 [Proteobacteria bacterium]|nr:hypothetical protein [Pseudomonadota bacterium]